MEYFKSNTETSSESGEDDTEVKQKPKPKIRYSIQGQIYMTSICLKLIIILF